jgi:hypothetical protein
MHRNVLLGGDVDRLYALVWDPLQFERDSRREQRPTPPSKFDVVSAIFTFFANDPLSMLQLFAPFPVLNSIRGFFVAPFYAFLVFWISAIMLSDPVVCGLMVASLFILVFGNGDRWMPYGYKRFPFRDLSSSGRAEIHHSEVVCVRIPLIRRQFDRCTSRAYNRFHHPLIG